MKHRERMRRTAWLLAFVMVLSVMMVPGGVSYAAEGAWELMEGHYDWESGRVENHWDNWQTEGRQAVKETHEYEFRKGEALYTGVSFKVYEASEEQEVWTLGKEVSKEMYQIEPWSDKSWEDGEEKTITQEGLYRVRFQASGDYAVCMDGDTEHFVLIRVEVPELLFCSEKVNKGDETFLPEFYFTDEENTFYLIFPQESMDGERTYTNTLFQLQDEWNNNEPVYKDGALLETDRIAKVEAVTEGIAEKTVVYRITVNSDTYHDRMRLAAVLLSKAEGEDDNTDWRTSIEIGPDEQGLVLSADVDFDWDDEGFKGAFLRERHEFSKFHRGWLWDKEHYYIGLAARNTEDGSDTPLAEGTKVTVEDLGKGTTKDYAVEKGGMLNLSEDFHDGAFRISYKDDEEKTTSAYLEIELPSVGFYDKPEHSFEALSFAKEIGFGTSETLYCIWEKADDIQMPGADKGYYDTFGEGKEPYGVFAKKNGSYVNAKDVYGIEVKEYKESVAEGYGCYEVVLPDTLTDRFEIVTGVLRTGEDSHVESVETQISFKMDGLLVSNDVEEEWKDDQGLCFLKESPRFEKSIGTEVGEIALIALTMDEAPADDAGKLTVTGPDGKAVELWKRNCFHEDDENAYYAFEANMRGNFVITWKDGEKTSKVIVEADYPDCSFYREGLTECVYGSRDLAEGESFYVVYRTETGRDGETLEFPGAKENYFASFKEILCDDEGESTEGGTAYAGLYARMGYDEEKKEDIVVPAAEREEITIEPAKCPLEGYGMVKVTLAPTEDSYDLFCAVKFTRYRWDDEKRAYTDEPEEMTMRDRDMQIGDHRGGQAQEPEQEMNWSVGLVPNNIVARRSVKTAYYRLKSEDGTWGDWKELVKTSLEEEEVPHVYNMGPEFMLTEPLQPGDQFAIRMELLDGFELGTALFGATYMGNRFMESVQQPLTKDEREAADMAKALVSEEGCVLTFAPDTADWGEVKVEAPYNLLIGYDVDGSSSFAVEPANGKAFQKTNEMHYRLQKEDGSFGEWKSCKGLIPEKLAPGQKFAFRIRIEEKTEFDKTSLRMCYYQNPIETNYKVCWSEESAENAEEIMAVIQGLTSEDGYVFTYDPEAFGMPKDAGMMFDFSLIDNNFPAKVKLYGLVGASDQESGKETVQATMELPFTEFEFNSNTVFYFLKDAEDKSVVEMGGYTERERNEMTMVPGSNRDLIEAVYIREGKADAADFTDADKLEPRSEGEYFPELAPAEAYTIFVRVKEARPEQPASEEPTSEVPATEAPATEQPTSEAPATEAPTTQAPATEAPSTQAPATETPSTQAPATEAPSVQAPATEAPAEVGTKVTDSSKADTATYTVTEKAASGETGSVTFTGDTGTAANVTIPETIKGSDGVSYQVTKVDSNAMKGNTSVKTVTFSDSVEEIGAGAFQNATSLATVKLGTGVTTIGKNAFAGCTSLKKVTVKSKEIKTVAEAAFKGAKKLTAVDLSASKTTTIGKNAFNGDKQLKTIKLNGNTLKKVGKNAFKGIKKNATITIAAKDKKTYNKVVKMIKKSGVGAVKFKYKKKK